VIDFPQNFFYAGALATVSRWLRHRSKKKHPEKERVEVHLPEWSKFLIYWVIMYVWCEFVDALFWVLFHVK